MSRIHEALKKAEEEMRARAKAAPAPVQPLIDDALTLDVVAPIDVADAPAVGAHGIHEPLRKAEEEARVRAKEAPAAVQPLIHGPLAPEIVPSASPGAAAAASARSDASQPLTWDMVAARCTQRAWKPAKSMLFLNGNTNDQVGREEFRTLRSRLYHVREKRPLKTILVGSALPAEGKSFVSANLAQTLARQHGRRVVILDCDLRRAHLHEAFGTDCEPGITDYLRGEADEFSILQRGPIENLAFIPGGRQISNPAELIGNGRLQLLLTRLAEVFDWIVVDSPPAVPVADASMIARFCDGILLVVMAAKTPFDLAQRARDEFRNMPLLGVVLNRVDADSTYVSYYYGAYGKPGTDASG